MKKIRIGKDIVIEWAVLTNGEKISLEGRDLKLVLISPLGRKTVLPLTVSGNVLHSRVNGVDQHYLGKYRLTLWENFGKINQSAVDECNAYQLVATSCEEAISDIGLASAILNLSTDTNVEIYFEVIKNTNEINI